METAAPAGRPRSIMRWTFLGGIIYVVLFVIGVIMLFNGSPDGSATPTKVANWYADSGHRDRINIGWILIGLSLFFLLWFVAGLRRAVSLVDGEGVLTAVVGLGGGIYIAVAAVSVALSDGIRTMSDDTYQHKVFPELIHAADDATWMIHATGALGLAAMIIAASLALMWAGSWPTWAGWLGVVVGILSLGSVVFFPQFLFLLWILIVSIMMFLRSAPAARTAV
jgi:hypothetical protein